MSKSTRYLSLDWGKSFANTGAFVALEKAGQSPGEFLALTILAIGGLERGRQENARILSMDSVS